MDSVLHSFGYSLDFLREQVADVADRHLAVIPTGFSNHPAWTIGHIAFACQMLGAVAGVGTFLPVDWGERHGPGSLPSEDRSKYGSKDDLLAALQLGQERITTALRGLDDAALDKVFPVPAYREVFPTVRHAFTQVLVGHTSFHVGQVSVWRRMMKLAPMGRSFE